MAETTSFFPVQPRTSGFVSEVAPVIDAEQIIQDQRKQRINDYNFAVDHPDATGKIDKLNNVIKGDPADLVASAAIKARGVIQNNTDKFNNIVAPIEKAGGVGTPNGNMAVAKAWETQKDHPEWGTALISYLMGDKKAALNYVTGGQSKDQVIWGKDGGRYIATVNELGQMFKVKDASNNELSPKDVEDLGISYDSYEKTQAAKNEELTKTARTEAINSDTMRNNAWDVGLAAVDAQSKLVQENIKNATADIPAEKLKNIYGTFSKAVTNAVGGSTNKQDITTEGSGTSASTEKGANLGSGASVGTEGTNIGAKTGAQASSKVGSNVSKTTQRIAGETAKKDLETNISQNRDTLKQEAQLQGLNTTQINSLLNAYDMYVGIQQTHNELTAKYGKPAFISNPQPTKLGDQQSQLEAQLLLVQHNAAQMAAYKKHFNDSIADYKKTKTVPDFGQIDSEFMKTGIHNAITNDYGKAISNSFRSDRAKLAEAERYPGAVSGAVAPVAAPVAAAPVVAPSPVVAPPVAAVAPPVAPAVVAPAMAAVPRATLPRGIPAGSQDTGKFSSSGKKVYRAPNGTFHTED